MKSSKYEVADDVPRSISLRKERIDWEAGKKAMLENPGKWVKIATNVAASNSRGLQRGERKAFPLSELSSFEFTTSRPKPADGEAPYATSFADIWGRYSA